MINFNKILTGLKDFAESEVPLDLLFIAVNETKAEFTNRAFNSESGSKDVKGKGLGGYSNTLLPTYFFDNKGTAKIDKKEYPDGISYKEFRKINGRQTKVVDLEFTGSLRRDLKVIRSNDTTISMLYLSPEEQKKIGYLENNYKTSIFELSESEQLSVFEKCSKSINQEIKYIIENGLKK